MPRPWHEKSRPWSKLKGRVEALRVEHLDMAIHCNVFSKVTAFDTFYEPRHWIVLDDRVIWDFPGPFLRPDPVRGKALEYWEQAYGWGYSWDKWPSVPSVLMREYLDRPRDRLMEPFDDPFELADILRAADRRHGRAILLSWAETLDDNHPARPVIGARFDLITP